MSGNGVTSPRDFVGYEYKELSVPSDRLSFYLDGYLNFGWVPDEHAALRKQNGTTTITLKRDRHIVNKAELTRLQRNFDACTEEIQAMERAKTAIPSIQALTVGVIGTAFMALSTFAAVARPPHVLACILFAVPGFLGWILPYFIYRRQVHRKTVQLTPLIEEKLEEAYNLCERGHQLLPK